MIGSDGESHRGEVHTPQVRASTKNTRYDPEIPEIPEIKLKIYL